MDARLKYFSTADKIKIYYEWWMPDEPKAILIFVHGLGDHVGRYGEFVRYFATQGFGVCLYDQRGHGRSGGRRVHCRSFEDFTGDLAQLIDMINDEHPSVPKFLIGHSFGGEVALNYVARHSKKLHGLIALSPNIEPLVTISKWKRRFSEWASVWLPIIKVRSNVDPVFFSHDENVVNAAKSDPMMSWHVSCRLGMEILKNLDTLPMLAFQIKVPVLFMQGGDDKICSVEATKKFFHNLIIRNKEFKVYPGRYHELLNEDVRGRVMDDINAWLNNQLMATRPATGAASEGSYEKELNLWHYSRGHFSDGVE